MDYKVSNENYHVNSYCGPWAPKNETPAKKLKKKKIKSNKSIKKKKNKSVKNQIVKNLEPIDSGIGPCDSSVHSDENKTPKKKQKKKKNTSKKTGGKENVKKKKNKFVRDKIVRNSEPIDSDIGPCDSTVCDTLPNNRDFSTTETAAPCNDMNVVFDSCNSTVCGTVLSQENNDTVPNDSNSSIESCELSESDLPLALLAKKIQEKKAAEEKTNAIEGEKNQSTTDGDNIHTMLFGPQRALSKRVTYEIMPGYRYNSSVLFCPEEQQFYLRNSTSKIGIGYTCYVKECKCRMHVRDNICYVANTFSHDHGDKTEMYYNLCALNEMKRILRSVENRSSPKQVFDDVMTR